MSELHPDHLTLLALAKRAFSAESGPLWKNDTLAAVEIHSVACDHVWDELRRQVDAQAGKIPVIDHPTVKQQKMAARMRSDIIQTCIVVVTDALEAMEAGNA